MLSKKAQAFLVSVREPPTKPLDPFAKKHGCHACGKRFRSGEYLYSEEEGTPDERRFHVDCSNPKAKPKYFQRGMYRMAVLRKPSQSVD